MDHWAATLELKTVDVPQRLISGYAAAHHNIDRVRDIIDPGASEKAVRRLAKPSDVAVLIAHDDRALPVGIPQKIEATPQGLYTETYVLKGPAGDNLLAVAKDLLDHGLALGLSIGYKTQDSRMESTARGRVRRLLDYELKEYSFAAHQAVANPLAVAHSVKSRHGHKALGVGTDAGGGSLVPDDRKGAGMQYRVEQRGSTWVVLADADADGDEDDNQVVGSYGSQEMANAVALALRQQQNDAGDTDDDAGQKVEGDGETARRSTTMNTGGERKATWDTAYQNDLPDSSFLFVEDGGQQDSDGKTVPRSKRHFPYKDASGKVDMPHLRNAIARIPQSNAPGLDDTQKAQLQARARRILGSADDGKTYAEPEEWKMGSALAVYQLGCRLVDVSEQLAEEMKALALLGEETKGYQRIRPTGREALRSIEKDLRMLVEHAERIDRGEDGAARVAWLKQQFALTGV